MQSIINYIQHPSRILLGVVKKARPFLSDKIYLQLRYLLEMDRVLHLRHPRLFTEKIQWLKLYDRRPEYTQMVDKYAVKEFVAKIIGSEYIIPTLGVWDRPEDIEWERLPQQFVLKTTHGGGGNGVVIVRDKDTIDRTAVVEKLAKAMKSDIYRDLGEWPYKNVPRRIIAEKFMLVSSSDFDSESLPDYKFYCFNGEPKYCQVILDRYKNETIDFFDMNWKHQEFYGLNPKYNNKTKQSKSIIEKPKNLEEMRLITSKLAKNISFVRIDLYVVQKHTYFGEITFYPASGIGVFTPDCYDKILGYMINLPCCNNI